MKICKRSLSLMILLSLSTVSRAEEVKCEPEKVLSRETSQLANATAPQCFDERPDFSDLGVQPQEELYKREVKVCSCLKSNKFTSLLLSQAPLAAPNASLMNEQQANVNSDINHINDHYLNQRNAMFFQAVSLGGTKQDPNFLKNYNMGYLQSESQDFIQEANKKIKSAHPELTGLEDIKIPPQLDKSYLQDNASDCLQIRDFLALNQIPDKNSFYGGLNKLKAFDPKDWVVEDLQRSDNPEDEARISFLKANPLYKNLFSVKSPSPVVKKQQENLFILLKKSFGNVDGCEPESAEGNCRDMYLVNGAHPTNLHEIKKIFDIPEVISAVNNQAEESLQDTVNKELRGLTKKMRLNIVILRSNYDNDNCDKSLSSAPASEYSSCVQKFGSYCDELKRIEDYEPYSKEENDDADITKYSVDPSRNLEFQIFKSKVCEEAHSDGLTPPKLANFSTFKTEYCTKNPGSKDCTSQGRKELLAKFIMAFPFTKESGHVDQSRALVNFLTQTEVAEVSEEVFKVVAEANKTKEDFRQNVKVYAQTYTKTAMYNSSPTDFSIPSEKKSHPERVERSIASATAVSNFIPEQNLLIPQINPVSIPKPSTQATTFAPQAPLAKPLEATKTDSPKAAALGNSGNTANYDKLEKQIASLTKALAEETKAREKEQSNSVNRLPAAATPSAVTQAPTASSSIPAFAAPMQNSIGPISQATQSAGPQRESFFPMNFSQSGAQGTVALTGGQSLYNVKYSPDKSSADGKIILAKEIQSSSVDAKVLAEAKKHETVPVTVTKEEYDKIASKDESVLSALATKMNNFVGDVLQLKVVSETAGLDPLHIIFMKKDGKMLFQPIRKYRLDSLKQIVKPI